MKHLSDAEKWKQLAKSDVNQAVSDLSDVTAEKAGRVAEELGVAYMVNVISQLGSADAADVLLNLPEDFREEILKQLSPELAATLQDILSYPRGSAGSLMSKEVLSVPMTFTVGETTAYLRSLPKEKKGKVSYIYVVDDSQRLEGVIQVRDLIFYARETPVTQILKGPVVQVETGMTQPDVARLLQRHRYLGLPVVDKDQRLVGVISADTAMSAMEDEASDDIAKIVGTAAEELKTSSVLRILRLRTPWLFVNIASGLLCAIISGVFQSGAQNIMALFLFVPVVLGLSESTGVQGATMVVRNMALGRMRRGDLAGLFLREFFVGIFIGIICGITVGMVAFFWLQDGAIGMALSVSMILAIILSALIGLVLPVLFRRLKIDPAVASGPLVLAICDLQTLFVYFTVASLILRTMA